MLRKILLILYLFLLCGFLPAQDKYYLIDQNDSTHRVLLEKGRELTCYAYSKHKDEPGMYFPCRKFHGKLVSMTDSCIVMKLILPDELPARFPNGRATKISDSLATINLSEIKSLLYSGKTRRVLQNIDRVIIGLYLTSLISVSLIDNEKIQDIGAPIMDYSVLIAIPFSFFILDDKFYMISPDRKYKKRIWRFSKP